MRIAARRGLDHIGQSDAVLRQCAKRAGFELTRRQPRLRQNTPVLAGSGACALGWTTGLDRKLLDAKAFYGMIAVSTLLGIGINFVGLDLIKALFWSAVINGVVEVPLLVIIMLMALRHDVMGCFVLPRGLWAMGWLCRQRWRSW